MLGLVSFLTSRPVVTHLIVVFIFAAAIATGLKIQRQGLPRVDLERVLIETAFPGASPEDVELNVTIKIEDALKEVEGIEETSSRSMEGRSRIRITIDPDAEDKERVRRDIQRAVESVSDLPEEVEESPFIFDQKADNWPTYEVAIVHPEEKVRFTHSRALKKRLMALPSVSKLGETGLRKPEIQILLDLKKLKNQQIALDEVVQAIKNNKLRVSGGTLESYTTEKGIITLSEFDEPKTLERLIIRSNDLGQAIRIKDIGRVARGFERSETRVRYNGEAGTSLWVFKKGNADVIDTVQKVQEVIQSYREKSAPPEMKFLSTYDSSADTRARLKIVYSNALIGFLLVLAVLFFFLDRKIAFWTSMGIPISIAASLILMPTLGITINSISLCGVIIVLGMVVDDAIIVAESIYRARQAGEAPLQASQTGLKQVVKPVFGMIITTMIAFSPIYFFPGTIGKFSQEIPTIVILMLAASFLEATILLPSHLALSRKDLSIAKKPPGQRLIDWIEQRYVRFLEWILKRKALVCLALAAAVGLGALVSKKLTRFELFPIDQSFRIWISGATPRGSSLEFTSKETRHLEAAVQSLPKELIHSFRLQNGRDMSSWMTCSNCFTAKLVLVPASQRSLTATEIKARIQEELTQREHQLERLDFRIESGGPPTGRGLEIRLIGNDSAKRIRLLEEVMEDLKTFPLTEITSDYRRGKEEFRLLPKYSEIAAANLTVREIAVAVRTSIDGSIASYLHTPEERIPFRVLLNPDDIDIDNPLKSIYVRNRTGSLVPIRKFVEVKKVNSPMSMVHFDNERMNRITANIDTQSIDPKDLYLQLKEHYQDFSQKHPGFKLDLGGEAQKSSETFDRVVSYILLAVLAIYFLLIVQFNSFSQPFMVILAVPFGIVGITAVFGVFQIPLSLLGLMGALGFCGVVVNDSLIMVDTMNRTGNSQQRSSAEIILGARTRFRPILLTTLTTLAGLIPTAYGWIGGFDSFVSPMVLAMTWGLVIGTVSVLIVIPLFYSIHGVIHQKMTRFFSTKLQRNNQ